MMSPDRPSPARPSRRRVAFRVGAFFGASLAFAAGHASALAAASRLVSILQGQSNAELMQDGVNGYQYSSTFSPMVKGFTGIATFNAYANRFSDPNGLSIFPGTPTYQSGPEDASLWLDANSTTPGAWPLGSDGQSCSMYVTHVLSLQSLTGVPVGFFRIHSENDTKKTGTDAGYYQAANQRFVSLMRQASALPTSQMPIFYGSPSFWNGVTDQGLATVRSSWLAEINNPAANAHWAWGCVSDCNDMGDASHMNALGDQQACARMAVRYARWLYDNGYSANDLSSLPKLGPRVLRFDRVSGVSNQIDLTIQHDKGTDVAIPSGGAAPGFEVVDGSNKFSATAAQRLDGTHIRLTLSGNLSASTGITLDYLRQNGFYGPGALITDNWHTLSKPSYIQSAINSYFSTLTMALRKFEQPLTIGVTAPTSLEDTTPAAQPVRYEAESLTWAAWNGPTPRGLADSRFSGGNGIILDGTYVGSFLTFLVPNVAAGSYGVKVGVKNYTGRGIWQLAVGRADSFATTKSNVGPGYDQYNPNEVFTEIDLGAWAPGTTSDKWFQFMITGKNGNSASYTECIDYITLTPQ